MAKHGSGNGTVNERAIVREVPTRNEGAFSMGQTRGTPAGKTTQGESTP
jgi:hypothetical protein